MDDYPFNNQCITLTFSNVVENNVGMQKIGSMDSHPPFSIDQLKNMGGELIMLALDESLQPKGIKHEPAAVLVIRDFYNQPTLLFNHLLTMAWDKQALMRGQVKNKRARYNLCFSNNNQEPDYQQGKGRVVNIKEDPLLSDLQHRIGQLTNLYDLNAEGNYYYDITKTGIGFHGDKERNIVVGLRLGETMPLCFQWYHQSQRVGPKMTIDLNHGDLYIMSEKAVGQDWMKRSQLTLRHAAGCHHYTK